MTINEQNNPVASQNDNHFKQGKTTLLLASGITLFTALWGIAVSPQMIFIFSPLFVAATLGYCAYAKNSKTACRIAAYIEIVTTMLLMYVIVTEATYIQQDTIIDVFASSNSNSIEYNMTELFLTQIPLMIFALFAAGLFIATLIIMRRNKDNITIQNKQDLNSNLKNEYSSDSTNS